MSTSTGGVGVVVCGECGSANDADVSFCGCCGAYLEWEGERLQPGRPAPPVEEVEPPPEKHSLLDRVRAGLGIEADARRAARWRPPSRRGRPDGWRRRFRRALGSTRGRVRSDARNHC